ncbi:hypothetical protein [Rhodopseudomonas sp. BR0C11]|uniref:hypothetical protein n=1 Tax=Rhodopseudomonas sp. BR0C11 TaxID=2269370 RepID=UPI0013DF0419|nr:hypothetical protein [Rhodopseudomonas sp. BR0C11]
MRPTETRTFDVFDTWFKDCSEPTAEDGTEMQAAFLNGMIAALRSLARVNGATSADSSIKIVPEVGTDDALLTKAVQHLIQRGQPSYAVDTGSANAWVVTLAPACVEYKEGMPIRVKISNAVTGACTINVNGLGAKQVVKLDGSALGPGDLPAGATVQLHYDGTKFQLVGALANTQKRLTGALTLYVNGATGSDTAYDGSSNTVSGTAGPFATVQKAINVAAIYAQGPYAVTISIAAWGTNYAGASTPYYPIPTLIIAGAGSTSTVINGGASSCALVVTGLNTVTVQGCKLRSSGGSFAVLRAQQGAQVYIATDVDIADGGAGLNAIYAGVITVNSSIKFSGASSRCIFAQAQGTIVLDGATITLSAAITGTEFVQAADGGYVSAPYCTFVNPGNFTGYKYTATLNGVIETLGSGANYFPGSVAGRTLMGGQYA